MAVGVVFADPFTGDTYSIANAESLAWMVQLVQGTLPDEEYRQGVGEELEGYNRTTVTAVVEKILAVNGIHVRRIGNHYENV